MNLDDAKAYHREFYGASHGELAGRRDFGMKWKSGSAASHRRYAGRSRQSKAICAHPRRQRELGRDAQGDRHAGQGERFFYSAAAQPGPEEHFTWTTQSWSHAANYISAMAAWQPRSMDRAFARRIFVVWRRIEPVRVRHRPREVALHEIGAIAAPPNPVPEAMIREELERAVKKGFIRPRWLAPSRACCSSALVRIARRTAWSPAG